MSADISEAQRKSEGAVAGPAARPVHLAYGYPPGWERCVLPHRRARALRRCENGGVNASAAPRSSEEWWLARTGCPAAESRFTILVPIHNEQRYLRSMLSALMLSRIPPSVNAQIVLLANACDDGSLRIARRFLGELGAVKKAQLPTTCAQQDPGLTRTIRECQLGSIVFKLVNTRSRGKANALTIGNTLAIAAGHRIAICLDANNWPQPSAIARIFGALNRDLSEPGGGKLAVVGGRPIERTAGDSLMFSRQRTGLPAAAIKGWIMAWRTDTVSGWGEFPRTKSEDYAVGVVARALGHEVAHVPAARSWGYVSGKLGERIRCLARAEAGKAQLRHRYQHTPYGRLIREIMRADRRALRESILGNGFIVQCRKLIAIARRHPPSAVRLVGGFVVRRLLRAWAYCDYLRSPDSCSWSPIKSTK